ncbi:MAG: hypothetical protein Q4A19_03180 [Johnsonella sp.]|nr:hypothetical protein [Johnsonella sp.]
MKLNMRLKYRALCGIFALLVLISGMSMSAFASTKKKKKIKSVTFKISGNIEADTKPGQENLEISTNDSKYTVDSYEILNTTFRWQPEDVPQIKILLEAGEDFYFDISQASQVNIAGGSFVSATRSNGATTLEVTVKLPPLREQLFPIEKAEFFEDGTCTWDKSENVGSYEVKFYRNRSALGQSYYTMLNTINFRDLMTKEGNYYFKVRPISISNPEIVGDWTESSSIFIPKQTAQAILKEKSDRESAGTWQQDEIGYWFVLPDGSYPRTQWRKIHNSWYYFLDSGYMATGWQYINGSWYYLDLENGNLWVNATTPDGYQVSLTGELIE